MNEQYNDQGDAEIKMPANSQVLHEEPTTLINGPLLLMLAVLLVLVLSAMYFWFSTMSSPTPVAQPVERPSAIENNEPESTTAEAQTETMLTTSPSDDLGAIEADLTATDLDNLDAEMMAIEAEMEAAMQSN